MYVAVGLTYVYVVMVRRN